MDKQVEELGKLLKKISEEPARGRSFNDIAQALYDAGYIKSVPPPEQVEWLAKFLYEQRWSGWDDLKEQFKEGYRIQARSILQHLGGKQPDWLTESVDAAKKGIAELDSGKFVTLEDLEKRLEAKE